MPEEPYFCMKDQVQAAPRRKENRALGSAAPRGKSVQALFAGLLETQSLRIDPERRGLVTTCWSLGAEGRLGLEQFTERQTRF